MAFFDVTFLLLSCYVIILIFLKIFIITTNYFNFLSFDSDDMKPSKC